MLEKIHTCQISILNSYTCNSFCNFDYASVAPNSLLTNATFKTNVPRSGVQVPMSTKWKVYSGAKVEDTTVISDEEKKSWDACRATLSTFQFSIEEKNKILGKAFGHIHSPFWSEERAKETPRVDVVNKILNYLRSVNLSDDDIAKVVKKFPEVLGCNLEDELEKNVKILEKDWGIEGKTLKSVLLRNPKVLGYNVDCKGDCMAKCTRCWVRF